MLARAVWVTLPSNWPKTGARMLSPPAAPAPSSLSRCMPLLAQHLRQSGWHGVESAAAEAALLTCHAAMIETLRQLDQAQALAGVSVIRGVLLWLRLLHSCDMSIFWQLHLQYTDLIFMQFLLEGGVYTLSSSAGCLATVRVGHTG